MKARRTYLPHANFGTSLKLAIHVLAGVLVFVAGTSAAPRQPWTSNRVSGSPNPPAPYTVERVFPAVTFDRPVDFAFLPGTDRLVVSEERGTFWSFDSKNASAKAGLLLRLRDHHQPIDNSLGFTLHPGFAANHFIFINYNEPGGRENGAFVSRFTVSSLNPPTVDPASEKIILRWFSGGHNGCTLAFGNDGFLYISTGDAADPDPPDGKRKTGQDISDLLASVLRVDVDHASGTNAYAIPADNPFRTTPGARPEVWAFGFRNPFRMSIDRATGDLWLGDVGWEQWEMIHRVRRGGNYGWPITEGPNTHVRTDVTQGSGPILPPLVALPHSEAASITGGCVYRGRRLPKLRGAYIYGDWETGKFWALRHDGDKLLSNEELCDTTLKPVAFTLDPQGELLILDYSGGIYRFVPNAAPPANQSFPRRLSETGVFASLNPLVPAPGVVSYRINAPRWNDHATAEWLVGVPGDGAIVDEGGVGNIAGGTWFIPTNTVLARTLTLEMNNGRPESRRRIETQLLHWDGQAWNPYSFRWNSAQTDADLVPGAGTNDTFIVTDASAPGGRRETPWRFASRAECFRCHNSWAGETLTLNWFQLNSRGGRSEETRPPSEKAGELLTSVPEFERLHQLGVIHVKHPPGKMESLANPYATAEPLADRARSWLHVNCSGCHRFGAGGGVAIQLNFDKPLRESRALDEKPTRGDFGLDGARIIASGDPFGSVLLWRISTGGSGHMPLIGSRLVDADGVKLVHEWIASMKTPAGTGVEKSAPDAVGTARRPPNDSRTALALGYEATTGSPARRNEAAAAALNSTNAFTRDLLQRFLPPEQRRPTLGADIHPQTILALKGDARRGKELFIGASQCSRCHVCGGVGRAFGPDLSGIARKYTRAQVLEQILQPSKIIAPEFKTILLTLRDDTELAGFVLQRTADEIVLRDENLAERHVKRADVKESHESTLSAMPEGLLAPLTAQEAADLLEYLLKSQPPR